MNKFPIIRLVSAVLITSAVVLNMTSCSYFAAPSAGTAASTSVSSSSSSESPPAVESSELQTKTEESAAQTETSLKRTEIRIAALKGPTGMGLVNLMGDQDAGKTENDYSFTLSGSPDDIVAALTSGQADIAALPTNLAAVLYQKTNQNIQMLAINTLGVLYILEKGDTVHSLSDLSGRELLATGQGAVPEYVLNDLLQNAALNEPAKIEYKAEHAELATLAAAGKADLLMLPEPFVTTVLSKNPDYRIALDLTAEWQKIHQDTSESELAMGCLVVTRTFADAHPDAVRSFLAAYQTSTEQVNSDPAAAGQLIVKYGIMSDASLAESAIPNCHIVLIQGTKMQPILEPLYEILLAANPKSIGGSLPDANFYYIP